jgi:hypothetical protein
MDKKVNFTLKIILIILLFIIILFIFLTGFTYCGKNKLTLEEKSYDKAFLPVFIVPTIDYKKNNDIIGVSLSFIKDDENEKIIEYTILFKDEDHPSSFVNFIYDIYRSFKYKRLIDTESFFIYFVKSFDGYWKAVSVDFPDDYGSDQIYLQKNVKHFSLKIEGANFEKKDNRIVIYINTWNHMFSNKDTNINLEKITLDNYKTFWGSRVEVEKQFNKNYSIDKKN